MPDDEVSLARNVAVAAALREKVPPVVRLCSICGERLPGGIVKHPECRGWVT